MQVGDIVRVINPSSPYEYEMGVIVQFVDQYFGAIIEFIRENSLKGKRMGFNQSELEFV